MIELYSVICCVRKCLLNWFGSQHNPKKNDKLKKSNKNHRYNVLNFWISQKCEKMYLLSKKKAKESFINEGKVIKNCSLPLTHLMLSN